MPETWGTKTRGRKGGKGESTKRNSGNEEGGRKRERERVTGRGVYGVTRCAVEADWSEDRGWARGEREC